MDANMDPTAPSPGDAGGGRVEAEAAAEAPRLYRWSFNLARGIDRASGVADVADDAVPPRTQPVDHTKGFRATWQPKREPMMEPIQDDIETHYEPFDQERWLGPPPWVSTAAMVAWEQAHGHDVRLKCYVEFGCQVIEPTLERRIDRLVAERKEHAEQTKAWVKVTDILKSEKRALEAEREGFNELMTLRSNAERILTEERDRLIQGIGALVERCKREAVYELDANRMKVANAWLDARDELEALTKKEP